MKTHLLFVYLFVIVLAAALFISFNEIKNQEEQIQSLETLNKSKDNHIFEILRQLELCAETRDNLNNEVARLHRRGKGSFIK